MTSLDLLDFPPGARTEIGPVQRYARFPLPFSVGPSGTVRLDGLSEAQSWRVELTRGTPRFVGDEARLRSDGAVFRVYGATASVAFRLVADDAPQLRWPEALSAELARVAPGTAGLDVLADLLLERGHALGARLRGLTGHVLDADWLGDLASLEQSGRLDLEWARGVATGVVLRGLDGLDRVSAHVLTHLAQRVELVAWSTEAPDVERVTGALEALLAGGLPWLSTLVVHGLKASVGASLSRTWKKGRWAKQVAEGCSIVVPDVQRLVLVAGDRRDEVPARGFMQVGGEAPLCFVRQRQSVAELTVARPGFLLSGSARTRADDLAGPWVVALKPGDSFTIDGREWTVLAE